MDKKNIDWGNLGFGYMQTDKRYVSTWKDGAWDEGGLVDDANITMNECACVLQYAQTAFEGLKAYTTEDGKTASCLPSGTLRTPTLTLLLTSTKRVASRL